MAVSGMGAEGQPPGSPGMAVLAGLGVAVAGSVVWGLIAYLTKYQFSLMAVVLGFAVGAAMFRVGGRSRNTGLAVAGAALAVFGCALGSLAAEIMILRGHGVPLGLIMSHMNLVLQHYPSAVGGLGLFFWVIAALYGYRNALGAPMWGRGRARRPAPQAGGLFPGFGAGPQPPDGAGQPPVTGFGSGQPPVTGFGPVEPPAAGLDSPPPAAPEAPAP